MCAERVFHATDALKKKGLVCLVVPKFLWKTAKKSFLVLMPMAKDCTAACVFGPRD